MCRVQGLNANGELITSQYVEKGDYDFSFVTEGPSRTRQEFQDECDINTMMEKYEKSGIISHVNSMPGQYFDAADVPDYQMALMQIREAETAFASLPARARASFDNDPSAFVNFASDPANVEQMREWGLAPQPEAPTPPMKVEVINPAPVESGASKAP